MDFDKLLTQLIQAKEELGDKPAHVVIDNIAGGEPLRLVVEFAGAEARRTVHLNIHDW